MTDRHFLACAVLAHFLCQNRVVHLGVGDGILTMDTNINPPFDKSFGNEDKPNAKDDPDSEGTSETEEQPQKKKARGSFQDDEEESSDEDSSMVSSLPISIEASSNENSSMVSSLTMKPVLLSGEAGAETSSASSVTTTLPSPFIQEDDDSTTSSEAFPAEEEQEELNNLVLDLLIATRAPFSVVERPSFHRLINFLRPGVSACLPSRQLLREMYKERQKFDEMCKERQKNVADSKRAAKASRTGMPSNTDTSSTSDGPGQETRGNPRNEEV